MRPRAIQTPESAFMAYTTAGPLWVVPLSEHRAVQSVAGNEAQRHRAWRNTAMVFIAAFALCAAGWALAVGGIR